MQISLRVAARPAAISRAASCAVARKAFTWKTKPNASVSRDACFTAFPRDVNHHRFCAGAFGCDPTSADFPFLPDEFELQQLFQEFCDIPVKGKHDSRSSVWSCVKLKPQKSCSEENTNIFFILIQAHSGTHNMLTLTVRRFVV